MADPNIPPPPPGFTIDTPSASPFGQRPVIQQQMTPQDQAQLQHTTLENQNFPLQQQATRTNIEQGQTSIQNQRFNQNQGLRQEFNNLPEVKNYSTALNSLNTALKAPDTPQGDLAIIYAYAKAADPGSVVREGEMDMATATASLPEAYKAAAQRLTQGKRLPPEVRTGLIETMRQSVSGMKGLYDQQRTRYDALAKQNGFDPVQITGEPLYDAVRPAEEAYITAHGGIPRDPNAPQSETAPPAPTQTEQGFGVKPDSLTPTQSGEDFRNQLYSAMRSKQIKSVADIQAFQDQYNQSHGTGWSVDLQNPDTRRALVAAAQGKQFNVQEPVPNISDVRGKGTASDTINATARGVLDTATSGLIDKGVAAADTLFKGGPLDYNLQRQYAISDFDQANHPFARFGGQALGGGLLPLGEFKTAGQIVGKGALAGAAYGAGSSRSLSDVPQNALIGGIAGAAVPEFLGAGFAGRGLAARNALASNAVARGVIPPLVDPQTGALNQPLEAMTPGQRVVKAEEYGINLPADAAGGRTAAVMGKGLDINPGSAGVMEDARRATESQVAAASDVVASRYGQSRTPNEAGSELQKGAKQWMDRADATAGKLYDAIPINPGTESTIATTRARLGELLDVFRSNDKMRSLFQNSRLKAYLDALTPTEEPTTTLGPGRISFRGPPRADTRFEGGSLSWQDLKHFRSIVGEDLGEQRLGGDSPYKSQLKSLYGALSEDMRSTAAAQGPGALKAFERANTFYQQKEARIEDALTRILGPDAKARPEKAAAAVAAMTKGGKSTGDLRTLAQIRASTVKSGAWGEIAATLIRLGGQPANSAGRDFNPQTFVNWYADMSEPARAMLFGNSELRKSLDGFVAVNQRLQKVNALRNTSNTAGGLVAAGTATAMTAPITMVMMGHPLMAAGTAAAGVSTAAGGYAMARLWTNPQFVRLVTGYSKALASGDENAVRSQIGRIGKLAATNPDLREPLIALQQRLLNHANDNTVGRVAASPNSDDKTQNQQ